MVLTLPQQTTLDLHHEALVIAGIVHVSRGDPAHGGMGMVGSCGSVGCASTASLWPRVVGGLAWGRGLEALPAECR